MVIVSLMQRPKPGDRSIGLLAGLVRWWSKMATLVAKFWTASMADHWNSAVAGSSALRQALLRSFMDESINFSDGSRLGAVCHASNLFNIDAFYDSIEWFKLTITAADTGFPPTLLAM